MPLPNRRLICCKKYKNIIHFLLTRVDIETKLIFLAHSFAGITKVNIMTEEVSRRDFVKMAGVAIGGIALGAVGGYSLVSVKRQ